MARRNLVATDVTPGAAAALDAAIGVAHARGARMAVLAHSTIPIPVVPSQHATG